MKDSLKLVLVLTVICAAGAALLAAVYRKTEQPIAQSVEKRAARAAALVMPPGCDAPRRRVAGGIPFFTARKDGALAAIAVEGSSKNGYGGPVSLMVGLGLDGRLVSFEVVRASETPGLGSKLSSEAFRAPIRGRPIAGTWKVKKDGGDVDAITAATISSRAAMECIRDAIAKFNRIRPAAEKETK